MHLNFYAIAIKSVRISIAQLIPAYTMKAYFSMDVHSKVSIHSSDIYIHIFQMYAYFNHDHNPAEM